MQQQHVKRDVPKVPVNGKGTTTTTRWGRLGPEELIVELTRVRTLVKSAADRAGRIDAASRAKLMSGKKQVASSRDLLSMHKRVTWLHLRRKRDPFVLTDKLSAALLRTDYLIRQLDNKESRRRAR